MSRDTITHEIDGHKYQITQLGSKEGRRLMLRLIDVAGEGIAKIIASQDSGNTSTLNAAAIELIAAIKEKDLEYLCSTFGASTKVIAKSGEASTLDDHVIDDWFAGRYDTMIRWLKACIEVNYAPLFDMLKSATEEDKQRK